VTIAGGASLGAEGTGATVTDFRCEWRWPRDLFVLGVTVVPADGTVTALASLELRVIDEDSNDLVSAGGLGGATDNQAPMLAQQGLGQAMLSILALPPIRPLRLQRPVRSRDPWLFKLANISGAPIDVAAMILHFAEARPAQYAYGQFQGLR
jgi:hypothetical protein